MIEWIKGGLEPYVDWKELGSGDIVNATNVTVAMLAILVSILVSLHTRRQSVRVERSQAYLALEVHSSEIFKYEAEHVLELKPFRLPERPPSNRGLGIRNAAIAYNLYFQTLNLFEVCARFRRQGIIEGQVFASWVAWFYDTLDDWYFRESWAELRTNYTSDVRDIMDVGLQIVTRNLADGKTIDSAECRRDFWAAVAEIMQCKDIGEWLDNTNRKLIWPLESTLDLRGFPRTRRLRSFRRSPIS